MPKLIVSLAAPTVASQLISILYNTADTYFVSQISTSASAAVGVVFSLQSIIQAYGFGVAMGASSLISLRLGEKRDREANAYASSGFFAETVGGVWMLIFGLLFLEPLMRILGATETMLPHAKAYGRIILMGAPIMCCSFILNSILRSEGAATAAMAGLCSGGILNIALDPLFIFTFGMGTAGAAVATVLSQCVSLVILGVAFAKGRSIVRLHPRDISRRLRDYGQILAVGFPTIARQGLASLASALLNLQAGVYSDAAVAALTISNKIYLLVRSVVLGIGQGFQPVAGYNYGAGDKKRTKEAFTEDGYFKTNDLGAIDKKGRFMIKGRLNNMILGPSGENIYPEEIEKVIKNEEGGAEAIVVQRNKTLIALIELSDGVVKDINKFKDALLSKVNSKISHNSKIGEVQVMKEPFVKTATQKIRRFLYKDSAPTLEDKNENRKN